MRKMLKQFLIILFRPLVTINRFVGTPILRAWAHAYLSSRIKGKVDSSSVFLSVPEIQGTGNISLGKNLLFYRDLYLETQDGGEIAMDDDCVISRGVHIVSHDRITIGRGTMIGEYTSIRDANHYVEEGKEIRHSGYRAKPIVIGSNVWIGRGVMVLPGVTIGDHAVIGANAVVTGDVSTGSTYVGVPARVTGN